LTSPEERKVVTVLFADLAGSTELTHRHDPEQLRQLLSAFFEEMSQQIRSFDGTVEKYAGDAIMAVFGVPKVHEDDAERAVRAGLAMRESLAQLNPLFEQEYGARLALRVGIATGEAVAATDERREMLVTGETANLAARLQAAGSGIVVSEATHRLLAPLLECHRLEPLALKGFARPVVAYEVSGLKALDATPRGIPGLSSPVVGRDAEAATLRLAIAELQRGRGQIVFLLGEAGLGKSRLKIELRETLPEGVRWLEGRCQAYTQTTSYAPVIQLLRAALGLGKSDAQAVARTRLRAGLRSLVGDRYEEVQPTVAYLLGIEIEARRHAEQHTDPQALKSQLVLALRALLESLIPFLRDHLASGRREDHADREAPALCRGRRARRRRASAKDPAPRDIRLDGARAGARHLDHDDGAPVRARRVRAEPARYARAPGFQRGHVPDSDGGG